MELAVSLNVFDAGVPHQQAIERCAGAGFRALDFNYWDYQHRLLEQTWRDEEAWVRAIRAAADAAGARFLQTHGPVFATFGQGTGDQAALPLSERALRAAAILGAKWVVLHPYTPAGPLEAAPWQAVRAGNAAFICRLLPEAERTGVGIALENLTDRIVRETPHQGSHRRFGAVLDELLDLIDSINHPLVGACWDTGHAHVQGLDQGAALRALGRRLKATHIHDNDGLADRHVLPFQGTMDWPPVMQTLATIRYSGALAYEIHNAIRVLPDALRDAALRYAYEVGRFLWQQAGLDPLPSPSGR